MNLEFCLNCVSHTASYLRLWALSLAHQQLSAVLWSMTLGPALKSSGIGGAIYIVITFTAFFALSCIILIIMEGVSAMASFPQPHLVQLFFSRNNDANDTVCKQLHSLRLAWVESFSKFAEFAGWPFVPFSFKAMIEESEELKEYTG